MMNVMGSMPIVAAGRPRSFSRTLTLPESLIRFCVVLALVGLLGALPAQAAQSSTHAQPADAVKDFFVAVTNKDYATAWHTLTAASQTRVVNMVAKEEKMDPRKVRQLFDRDATSVQRGFWDSFRASSKASIFASRSYSTLSVTGKTAKVAMEGVDPHKLTFQVFQEGGKWHFGLVKTFHL